MSHNKGSATASGARIANAAIRTQATSRLSSSGPLNLVLGPKTAGVYRFPERITRSWFRVLLNQCAEAQSSRHYNLILRRDQIPDARAEPIRDFRAGRGAVARAAITSSLAKPFA